MLKAVLFDMDGVIIDSEPMHSRAAILALKKYNVDITIDYVERYIGSTTFHMCQQMVTDFAIDAAPEELFKANEEMKRDLLLKEGHTVIPHIIDLIKDLHTHGIQMMIASSSPGEAIEEVMEVLQIKEYFAGYVSGMHQANPKPAPDIFLAAAARLGLKPEECIVIEDSENGINAAYAAGITGIGFVNPNSGKQNLGKATMLVEGFEEVNYNFIQQIYWQQHAQPQSIPTEHLVIRELETSDAPRLFSIYQEPELQEFLDDFSNLMEIEERKLEAYINNVFHYYGYGLWGVYLKERNELIGRCGIEYKIINGSPIYELGYLISKEYHGNGFGAESVRAVLDYSFHQLHIPQVTAIVDKRNLRSIHLAEHVGMKRNGEIVRSHRDCYLYEITDHDYLDNKMQL